MKNLIFLLAIFFSVSTFAQVKLTGIVCNKETGKPIPNTEVFVLGTKNKTLTDTKGQYTIECSSSENKVVFDSPAFVVKEVAVSELEKNTIVSMLPKKMSSATGRWQNYIESDKAYNALSTSNNPDWSIGFDQSYLKGDLAPDTTMVRRDPSAVIKVGKKYYTYYTRGTRYNKEGKEKFFPWDECDIWYATSKDGITWKEKGLCVKRGERGKYDDQSVFTPEILAHDGKYYLVYQCVKAPYVHRVKNTVGLAISDSPDGPWVKLEKPILCPVNNGEWAKGEHNEVIKKGDFDSHKVHDPCLLFYNNKFYLYYKGERMGEERMYGQREIKWGVAIADKAEGPYVRSPYNPITNSGHEVCIWPYNEGIALIHTDDGPERHTVQWAPDGINFEIMGKLTTYPPKAFGIYRTEEHDKSPKEGIRWGLCHAYGGSFWRTGYNYIKRFQIKE